MTVRNARPRSSLSRFVTSATKGSVSFPAARYFATMGELAEHYGGTSNVIFHRSNAIAKHTGKSLEILTFGHLRDYAKIDLEMHADGRLAEGVHFRNMWTDLSHMGSKFEPEQSKFESFTPLDETSTDYIVRGDGVAIRRFRQEAEGKALQIDMLRPDGSIIVSDRRDVVSEKSSGGHSLILCDQASQPVKEFSTLSELRRFWLDFVIGDSQAIVFSDSFGIAGLTHTYNRPNVVVIQTFHNHHLRHGESVPSGYVSSDYLPFLKNIDDFDATVYLTERQVSDIDYLMGKAPNRWVIPNSRSISTVKVKEFPSRTSGIMVGRLVPGKQTGHAVQAIARANKQLDDEVTLDIYGEGADREKVEATIADLDLSTVHLHGYDPAAPSKFTSASFSLLTSRSEAMSLVLVESMARGCIPIAYDVRYGPREIINDGVNGLLVDPNDIDGMSRAIVRLQNMSAREFAKMCKNARKRAKDFSDVAILRKWAHLLNRTLSEKRPPEDLFIEHKTTLLSGDSSLLIIRIIVNSSRKLVRPRAHIVLNGRDDPAITRVECKLEDAGGLQYSAEAEVSAARLDWFKKGIFDVNFDVEDLTGRDVHRLPFEGKRTALGPFSVYPTAHGNLSFKRS